MVLYGMVLGGFLLYINNKLSYEYKYKSLFLIASGLINIYISFYFEQSFFYKILISTLCVFLINITFIDLKYLEIPDSYNLFILLIGIINIISLKEYSLIISSILSFLFFFTIAMVSNGGLGGGDVKLSLGLGLFITINKLIPFFLTVFGVGAIASLILLMLKKKGLEDNLPFAPFMALGAILSILL